MIDGATALYRPRAVSDLGLWDLKAVTFKAYGLVAEGKSISADMKEAAWAFLKLEVLPSVAEMGDSNGLGFVILHPGDIGFTVCANWWAHGSVLCQHKYRKQYTDAVRLDITTRPVVGCVWELGIINLEQEFWRETMMQPKPDRARYLAKRPQSTEI